MCSFLIVLWTVMFIAGREWPERLLSGVMWAGSVTGLVLVVMKETPEEIPTKRTRDYTEMLFKSKIRPVSAEVTKIEDYWFENDSEHFGIKKGDPGIILTVEIRALEPRFMLERNPIDLEVSITRDLRWHLQFVSALAVGSGENVYSWSESSPHEYRIFVSEFTSDLEIREIKILLRTIGPYRLQPEQVEISGSYYAS